MIKMSTVTVTPIRREFQVHRFDALKHGVLSKHIVLQWEDQGAFEEILRGLLVEHQPQGPTAFHLVEDLAGVIWRKRRLMQAEAAAIRERLYSVTRTAGSQRVGRFALVHQDERSPLPIGEVVSGCVPTPEQLARSLAMVESALQVLGKGGSDAFDRALQLLDDDTSELWTEDSGGEGADGGGDYSHDAAGLRAFLESFRETLQEVAANAAAAPLMAEQAHGMAIDVIGLERIAKLEAHLDAKIQRLLRLLKGLKPTSSSKAR